MFDLPKPQTYMQDNFMADPFGGEGELYSDSPDRRTWMKIVDAELGIVEFAEVNRIDTVLENNKKLRNHYGNQKWGDGQLVASIPESIYWHGDFAKARGNNDQKWITKFLNDKDNEALRTREGKI